MAEQHSYGVGSRSKIATLAHPWPAILDRVLAACPFDLTVISGHRGRLAQDRAYALGHSTKQWPDSLHNTEPSIAVDLAPYIDGAPDWGEHDGGRRYYIIAGLVFDAFRDYPDYYCRWGGDWDRDGDLDDQDFIDLGHFEARRKNEGDTE